MWFHSSLCRHSDVVSLFFVCAVIQDLSTGMQEASRYLLGQLSGLSSPYSVAISTYALALLQDSPKDTLLNQLKRVAATGDCLYHPSLCGLVCTAAKYG